MLFGPAGAPATQQRMEDHLTLGIKWISAIAYLDDVIILSNAFEVHMVHLQTSVHHIKNGNLKSLQSCGPWTLSAVGLKDHQHFTCAHRPQSVFVASQRSRQLNKNRPLVTETRRRRLCI